MLERRTKIVARAHNAKPQHIQPQKPSCFLFTNKYKTTIPVTLKQTNAQCCTVCQNELEVGLQVPLQKKNTTSIIDSNPGLPRNVVCASIK